jgi:uncharacterized membrane protein YraQ (UPF0718 family)
MTVRGARTPLSYQVFVAGAVTFLALTLLTVLDVRRGFLFQTYPLRTFFGVFAPIHAVMLAAGAGGMLACYRGAKDREPSAPVTPSVAGLAIAIFAMLVVDLFAYRLVPATRSIAAGRVGADWLDAFGATGWMRPFAQATSFLLNVWHATMLGILISGLTLATQPLWLGRYYSRPGVVGSLFGAAFALPHPFCSCCSSVMASSFARRGASTSFLLSFVIGAPMLNITTVVLALALLPAPFAVTRIVAGLVVTILVTYTAARIADAWDRPQARTSVQRTHWWLPFAAFLRTRQEWIADATRVAPVTPAQLLGAWFGSSGRIALLLVPTLWIWSVVAAGIFQVLPSAFGNNFPSVVLAAVAGTFFMISTWSEIPMALQLIQSGVDAPAAALLVVLPAISLPCMILLGDALHRFRVVALLSAGVMLVGILAGTMFL